MLLGMWDSVKMVCMGKSQSPFRCFYLLTKTSLLGQAVEKEELSEAGVLVSPGHERRERWMEAEQRQF